MRGNKTKGRRQHLARSDARDASELRRHGLCNAIFGMFTLHLCLFCKSKQEQFGFLNRSKRKKNECFAANQQINVPLHRTWERQCIQDMEKLPEDPMILFSAVNMLLRDNYASLDELCDDMDVSRQALEQKLASAGFVYSEENKKFWWRLLQRAKKTKEVGAGRYQPQQSVR